LLAGVMGVLLERQQRRAAPRMPSDARASLWVGNGAQVNARFADLSASGCRLILDQSVAGGYGDEMTLEVHVDVLQRTILIPTRVAWIRGQEMGLHFEPESVAMQRDIVALGYGDSRRWVAFRQQRESQERPILSAAWFLVRHGWSGTVAHLWQLGREGVQGALRFILRRQKRGVTPREPLNKPCPPVSSAAALANCPKMEPQAAGMWSSGVENSRFLPPLGPLGPDLSGFAGFRTHLALGGPTTTGAPAPGWPGQTGCRAAWCSSPARDSASCGDETGS